MCLSGHSALFACCDPVSTRTMEFSRSYFLTGVNQETFLLERPAATITLPVRPCVRKEAWKTI